MAGDPVDVIVKVSQQYGLPPNIALATAFQESGLVPTKVGDNGTSFGLFQLHRNGELGNLTPQQAFDPETNAKVAIPIIAAVYHTHPDWSPGLIAYTAQRPNKSVRTQYINGINAMYEKAQGNPAVYWAAQTVANGPSEGDPNNATTAVQGGAGGSTLVGQLGAWASTAIPGFSALSGVTKLAEIVSAAVTSQNFWLRIGEALLGIALIVVGLVLLFKNDIEPVAKFAALA